MDGAGLAPGASPAGNLPHGPGYISVRPTVRIRREALQGGRTALVLCFKGAPDKTGLMREEIETEITPELFEKLERLIGKPLIAKRAPHLCPEERPEAGSERCGRRAAQPFYVCRSGIPR